MDTTGIDTSTGSRIEAGTSVEVHCRFDHRWTPGFTVAGSTDRGYRLRRSSDGSVLPAWFPPEQIRAVPRTR